MLGVFGNAPFKPRRAPRGTEVDLAWWLFRLATTIPRPVPGPVPIHDLPAFSDASSSTGPGIVIVDRWRAWRLAPNWQTKGRDIGWAEAVAFEFLVRAIAHIGNAPTCFRVQGDNQGVVEGWRKGCSRNSEVNKVFVRLLDFEEEHRLTVHAKYVASASNHADEPSRGVFPSLSLPLPPIAIPSALEGLIFDFDAPLSPDEQRSASTAPLPKQRNPTHAGSAFQQAQSREDSWAAGIFNITEDFLA